MWHKRTTFRAPKSIKFQFLTIFNTLEAKPFRVSCFCTLQLVYIYSKNEQIEKNYLQFFLFARNKRKVSFLKVFQDFSCKRKDFQFKFFFMLCVKSYLIFETSYFEGEKVSIWKLNKSFTDFCKLFVHLVGVATWNEQDFTN